jgi:hypothetical protein
MPPYAYEFYRVAVDDAARSAVSSFLAYGDVVQNEGSEAEAARLLHDALTHSAAVSRFFWPPKKSGALAAYRGEKLREIYKIDETSALFNRDLRNELEHFDEKLDNWLREIPVGPIIASPIFADHTIVDEGFGHAFKVVDCNNDIFVILGRKYDFGKICREVVSLLSGDDLQNEIGET